MSSHAPDQPNGPAHRFADRLRERAAVLDTVDPEAPLDDLEPLRALTPVM
ncbi:hypothetical protein [Streptomyces sp. NPDC017529]